MNDMPGQQESTSPDAATIRAREREYRVRRVQRAVEYVLLITLHLFFLISFGGNYSLPLALILCGATFLLNVQLTGLREDRRLLHSRHRTRLRADALEAVLFLLLVVILSLGGTILASWIGVTQQEYLAYVASTLGGLFLGGLAGELLWHRRVYRHLTLEGRLRVLEHLQRSIILPYAVLRRGRGSGVRGPGGE